ncbi:sensor histidine kinase [Treponema parvum]|uniref:sensor histidine kinase n=1 Tax=Treponema parvum TaxID=138851 RepID=UPI001AEBDF26|nr:sensor histidine kinase [Treponema parvum]QTQ16058.1 histidine kinase [Treponema parvum]
MKSQTDKKLRPFVIKYNIKISLAFSAVLLLAVFFVKVFGFKVASEIIKEDALSQSSILTKQFSERLDVLFNEIDRLSRIILIDSEILNALDYNLEKNSSEYLGVDVSIQNAMKHVLLIRTDIARILVSNGFNSYAAGPYNYLGDPMELYELADKYGFFESDELYTIIPPSVRFYNQSVFSFIRKIRHYDNPKVIGLIAVDMRLNAIDEIFSGVEFGESTLTILDAEGNAIYSQGAPLGSGTLDLIRPKLKKEFQQFSLTLSDGTNNAIVTTEYSDYSNLYVCGIIPEASLFYKIKKGNKMFNWITFFVFAISLVLIIVNSKVMTRPIRELLMQMKQIETGKRELLAVQSNDELKLIADSANHMLVKIIELMKRNSEITLRNREAQLKILQGQLDPHFLFNTLECIRMKAVIAGDHDTASMIEKLGILYRAVNGSEPFISLTEEIGYVENYIALQNIRFKVPIVLSVAVPPIFMSMEVPRLMLLTLAENSIRHGLGNKKDNRNISINAAIDDAKTFILTFSDNGNGISPEKLEELNKKLKMPPDKDLNHIGLRNLNSRIRLYYGKLYGLSVSSGEKNGTVIRIVLPWKV